MTQKRFPFPYGNPTQAPTLPVRAIQHCLLPSPVGLRDVCKGYQKNPDTHYHCVNLDSIIVAPLRREHSRKPDKMIPLIENLFDGPYLELFARTQPPG